MTTPVHEPDVSANTRPSIDKNDTTIIAESRDGENRSTQEKSLSAEADLEKGVPSAAASTLDDDTSQRTADAEDTDSNIVDWDGPDDPENPLNWPNSRKWRLVASLGAVTFITPLASSFFAPGVPQVMATFHERSNIIASLVVSIYILGFALGPLIISPMSEVYGRFYVYHVCNIFFVIFTIACAVSKSMGMLIVFRVLAGAAGSCPVTIGAGTLADIFPPQQRAKAMAIWALGPLFGPAVGPIAGGYLVEAKSWRWVFWIIAIFGGAVAVLLYVSSSETYGPVILERKAARLRKETGNMELRSKLDKGLPPKEVFMRSIVRPMKMLAFSPMVLLMSIYIGVNYAILYLFFTTMTFVFERVYHFSSGSVGLSYLGIGIGSFLGSAFVGIASDRIIVRKQALGKARPEHRLNLTLSVPGAICLPIGVFIYAWTTEKHVHWIVPILGTAFVGIGNISSMMTVTNYLVDAFTVHAASAVAANTVLRSVFGAFLPLAGLDMFASLGLGWGNSLLGFIALALIPVPIFFRFYGERIRTSKRFQVQF